MSEYIFVTDIFEYSNIRIYSSHSDWDHHHEGGEIKCPQLHCGGFCCDGQDNFDKPETEVQKIKKFKAPDMIMFVCAEVVNMAVFASHKCSGPSGSWGFTV